MTRNPLALRDHFADLPTRFGRSFDFLLWRDFDRLFDDFRGGVATRLAYQPAAQFAPRVDVSETDTAFAINAELPGLDAKEVEILIEGDRLTLKGEKKSEREAGDETKGTYLRERVHGAFQRAFRLPDSVDLDGVAAGFDKGVLTITLPKRPEKSKKVKIKAH